MKNHITFTRDMLDVLYQDIQLVEVHCLHILWTCSHHVQLSCVVIFSYSNGNYFDAISLHLGNFRFKYFSVSGFPVSHNQNNVWFIGSITLFAEDHLSSCFESFPCACGSSRAKTLEALFSFVYFSIVIEQGECFQHLRCKQYSANVRFVGAYKEAVHYFINEFQYTLIVCFRWFPVLYCGLGDATRGIQNKNQINVIIAFICKMIISWLSWIIIITIISQNKLE